MMTTPQGELTAHMCADLACQFARRHAAQGRHDKAAQCYAEAVTLYTECGCEMFSEMAASSRLTELDLAALYRPAAKPAPRGSRR